MTRQIAIVLWVGASLVGCQSYQPLTLDLDAHQASWAGRAAERDRVKAFADELAKLNAQDAAAFDPDDGLSLAEAELVALLFNPQLRVARLQAKAPLLGAREAGRWEDPEFDFDLLRFTQSVDDPWIVGASIKFTVPISGRLGAEKDKALAQANVEQRKVHLAEWSLLTELRNAWARWTGAKQRLALLEEYLTDLDEIISLARTQRKANRIGAPDLRVLELEKVTRVGQAASLTTQLQQQRLTLLAMLGLTPQAPWRLEMSLAAAAPQDADHRALLREHNLELAIAKAKYEAADRAFALEIRKQYPDLVIGPGYEDEEGLSRAGVVLSIPIPLLNQNRRPIAETRARRDAAKAAYEAQYEMLVTKLAQAQISARAAAQRNDYLTTQVAPMVDQQTRDLRRLAELGDLDVLVILDALTRTFETKVQVLEASVDRAVAVNALRSLLRPLQTPQAEEETHDK